MSEDLKLDELNESSIIGDDPILKTGSAEPDFDIPSSTSDLEAVYEIPVKVSAILGKAQMKVSQLMSLNKEKVNVAACRTASKRFHCSNRARIEIHASYRNWNSHFKSIKYKVYHRPIH